jgi:hypothetical protein
VGEKKTKTKLDSEDLGPKTKEKQVVGRGGGCDEFGPRIKFGPSPKRTKKTLFALEIGKDLTAGPRCRSPFFAISGF